MKFVAAWINEDDNELFEKLKSKSGAESMRQLIIYMIKLYVHLDEFAEDGVIIIRNSQGKERKIMLPVKSDEPEPEQEPTTIIGKIKMMHENGMSIDDIVKAIDRNRNYVVTMICYLRREGKLKPVVYPSQNQMQSQMQS